MYAFIINVLNALIRGLGVVLKVVLYMLPDSPFQKYIIENDVIRKYIGFINYFFPVAEVIVILEAWTVAIASFYIVQVVLRWIKAIQ